MLPGPSWPLWANITVFAAAALAIFLAGSKLAGIADRLADRTGLGEAMTGALFLGVSTSLPGITTSVTAAADGYPVLAVSNALGGIAAQTAFLAVADVFHRKVNLEHAAASVANIVQVAMLLVLLTLLLGAFSGPNVAVGHVHAATPLLIVAYGFGLYMARRSHAMPMWQPRKTKETIRDEPAKEAQNESLWKLLVSFALAVVVVFVAGFAIARSAGGVVEQTGLSESVVGGLFTAVATSLPELVTAVAAVRRGALTLAVGDIVGGNTFDILFICVADIAYLKGSIYHTITSREIFLASLTVFLNAVLILGLVQREKRGIANIGFESVIILVGYVGGFLIMSLLM